MLRYTTISDAVVKKNIISSFDRNIRLLKGLSEEVQTKVFEAYSNKGWRVLENDVETTESEFDDFS